MLFPAQLEVFYGAVDPAAAHVYVRWAADDAAALRGLSLGGTIRGPFNRLARTLPATVPLADQGPGESLLARGIVPDPCCWVPGAPYTYTVRVEARSGGHVVAEAERTLGIRPLGIAGRRFKLAGKTWLPRAIHREVVRGEEADDLAAWRELGAVMIARSPDDELCRRASEEGVLVFAEGAGADTAAELRRLERWPAVGMVLLSGDAVFPEPGLARNLLVSREIRADDRLAATSRAPSSRAPSSRAPTSRAPCLWLDAGDAELLAQVAEFTGPIVATRHTEETTSLAEARAACDTLQAELAGRVAVAGVAIATAARHA